MSENDLQKRGSYQSHLEPRVAKLEAGMQRLTDDVRDLAQVVRSQGNQMEQEIHKLVVSVTQASGPRKTEWPTIIAAIMLILTIGSAVFWPLNQMTQENKARIEATQQLLMEHQKLNLHPVGAALVQRLEDQIKIHVDNDNRVHDELRNHYHEDITTFQQKNDMQHALIDKYQSLVSERSDARLGKLESYNNKQIEKELDELNQWRQKAMGLPSSAVMVPCPPIDSNSPKK